MPQHNMWMDVPNAAYTCSTQSTCAPLLHNCRNPKDKQKKQRCVVVPPTALPTDESQFD